MIGLGRPPCDEGVIRGAPAGACADKAKPWVLVATILGSSMAFIDGSVVGVALPAIQADLGVSVRGAQWITNPYRLMLAALVGGGASVACGLAPGAPALIAARAAQVAMLVPGAWPSSAQPFRKRGAAIGTWAGFSALTPALGPVLGGWLVDAA